MADEGGTAVWVVAGCLFEVSLPLSGTAPWRFDAAGPEVTLLAEAVRDRAHRFRFRAEAAGAAAGGAELRFRSGDDERRVLVRIAPEANLRRAPG